MKRRIYEHMSSINARLKRFMFAVDLFDTACIIGIILTIGVILWSVHA